VIARGAVADLVLLDADPLQDIHNTTRINSVFVRGHLIDPVRRRQMLADIEAVVKQPRPAASVSVAQHGCPCRGAVR
jgi:hypothetical protein